MVLTEPMLLLVAALTSILLILAGASKCGQTRVVDRMVGGSVWTQRVDIDKQHLFDIFCVYRYSNVSKMNLFF